MRIRWLVNEKVDMFRILLGDGGLKEQVMEMLDALCKLFCRIGSV